MPAKAGAIRAGRAYIEAFLETTQLEQRLGRVRAKFAKFQEFADRVGGNLIQSGLTKLAPLAGAVKIFADAGTELQKLNRQTGETVEDLSRLKFAAGAASIEFDDLTGAAEELNIRLGEAAREGTGPLHETFQKLGLDARQLIRLPLAERLKVIGEALRALPDNAARGFAADEIFGGDAFKILPLLERGSEGIDKLMRRADELGVTMSGETAASAAELKETLHELWASAKGIAATVARALLPIVKEWSAWLTDFAPRARQFIEDHKNWIIRAAKLGATMVVVGAGLKYVATWLGSVATVANVLKLAIAGVTAQLTAMRAALMTTGVGALLVGGGFLLAWLLDSRDAAKDLNDELSKTPDLVKAADDAAPRNVPTQTAADVAIREAGQVGDLDRREARLREELARREQRETVLQQRNAAARDQFNAATAEFEANPQIRGAAREELFARQGTARKTLDETAEGLMRVRSESEKLRDAIDDVDRERRLGGTSAEDRDKIEKRLRELDTKSRLAGLDEVDRALEKFRELGASETALAEARERLTEINEREAAAAEKQRAAQEAANNARTVKETLGDLRNEIADLKLPRDQRDLAKQLREFRELGATPEQQEELRRLLGQREELLDADRARQSFTAQGGTFSALASRMFFTGESEQKKIAKATEETAKNTRKMARGKTPVYGE